MLVVLASLLAACASADSTTSVTRAPTFVERDDVLLGEDLSSASVTQRAEIADRKINPSEYHAAFNRFETCLKVAGYELNDVSERAGTFDFSVPDAAVQSGVDEQCYSKEFKFADMLWQRSRIDESKSADMLRACVLQHGVTPAATTEELVAQLSAAGVPLEACYG